VHSPAGGFVVRLTDRAFSVATSTNPLVRTARTRQVPRAGDRLPDARVTRDGRLG
jgi:hypothetical protein